MLAYYTKASRRLVVQIVLRLVVAQTVLRLVVAQTVLKPVVDKLEVVWGTIVVVQGSLDQQLEPFQSFYLVGYY